MSVGQGFDKFVVEGTNGNTNIAGTLTVNNTLTVRGATVENVEFFRLTNGGSTNVTERTTLEVDTATGDLTINGGDINIFGEDGTTEKLTFENSSGDLTITGTLSAVGDGTATFGGDITVTGDVTINGGDLTVNSDGDEIFAVDNTGGMTIARIENYITRTGGRTWKYSTAEITQAEPNVNYFINSSQNCVVKLPPISDCLIGDMIRIIDIGGLLTYNTSMVVRAPSDVNLQGGTDNTGTAMMGGVSGKDDLASDGWDGGELIVQTPYAAFTLVFAGSSTPDGQTAVPGGKVGWYIAEV